MRIGSRRRTRRMVGVAPVRFVRRTARDEERMDAAVLWTLADRAIGATTKLHRYLKTCRPSEAPGGPQAGERKTYGWKQQLESGTTEPRTAEPRTTEPRTTEPRTSNQERTLNPEPCTL